MIRACVVSLAVASVASAEGQVEREGLPSTQTRLRGATSIATTPLGIVSLGGSTLRLAKPGARAWEAVHRVEHDNLYRVADDDAGHLLAVWEQEPVFHVFTPATKQHVTIDKPPAPPEVRSWNVEVLGFAPGGGALVIMRGVVGPAGDLTVAFRVPLDGKGPPVELFRQPGFSLFRSSRASVFAVPQQAGKPCSNNGCWPIGAIVAWELTADGPVKRTLLTPQKDELHWAGGVWGSDDERLAVILLEHKNVSSLLRWRPGAETGDYRKLASRVGMDLHRLRLVGDRLVIVNPEQDVVEVKQLGPDGVETVSTIKALPRGDVDSAPDRTLYGLGARGTGLWLHLGNHLVLLAADGSAKAVDLEPMLKRRNEWAGVDLPAGAALWVGIEVGAGRDYVQLSWSELEARAKAW